MRRNKVILIKGQHYIARTITLAEYARIDADQIVLITALKYPQFLPAELDTKDPTEILENVLAVIESFDVEDQRHRISAEYANIVVDRGLGLIEAVEGQAMTVEWLYNTIRAYHKSFGQTVVDVEVSPVRIGGRFNAPAELVIDEVTYKLHEGIQILNGHQPSLG